MDKERKKSPLALKIILPLVIIALGLAGMKFMGKLKQEPARQQSERQGILVDTIQLKTTDHRISVNAVGNISANREIPLTTQVSGKVNWVSPQLVTGGFFTKGEKLLTIEAEDYRLAVEQARSEVAQAEVALAKEKEQARIAQSEWKRIELPDKGQPGPLVTREIQLRQQQAILAAAEANLQKAQLNLQRTELNAPFNGRIRTKNVDLGQYLMAGGSIGNFAGTDQAEIQLSLPGDELQWIAIPQNGQGPGAPATIQLPGKKQVQWQGQIVRSLGEIDTTSRTATVVVGINDPYQLKAQAQKPILPSGQFVEVELQGRVLSDVILIPRSALHTGDVIWLADQDNRLQLKQATLIRREKEQIIIANDDLAGQRLVLTNISGGAAGTLLRPAATEPRQ